MNNNEKKVRATFTIYQSVLDQVKARLGKDRKLSPFVENLLVTWCYEHDKIQEQKEKIEKLNLSDEDLKDIKKLIEEAKSKGEL